MLKSSSPELLHVKSLDMSEMFLQESLISVEIFFSRTTTCKVTRHVRNVPVGVLNKC